MKTISFFVFQQPKEKQTWKKVVSRDIWYNTEQKQIVALCYSPNVFTSYMFFFWS